MDHALLMQDIESAIKEYECLIGQTASRTRNMLAVYGPIGALEKLVSESRIQKGLKTLAKAGKLDLSFEAVIMKHDLYFKNEIVAAAKWRLTMAKNGNFQ